MTAASLDEEEGDIVQFSSAIYFMDLKEGSATFDVMRMGDMKGPCTVDFTTADGSAKADTSYRSSAGSLTFEEGESIKEIKVFAVVPEFWAATLEFEVSVTNPRGCQLGKYLHTCRVKVISPDLFPSNKYRDKLEAKRTKELNLNHLFWEFFKLCFAAADVNWRTYVTLAMDQVKNLYMLLMLWTNMYLVNVALNTHDEGTEDELLVPTRGGTVFIICCLNVGPMAVLHMWDLWKLNLDIAGCSTLYLRCSLFRKYLNYSEDSRDHVTPSRIAAAIGTDAEALGEGYVAMLDMVSLAAKIIINVGFVLVKNPGALWIAVILPSTMLSWMGWRESKTTLLRGSSGAKIGLMDHLNESCVKFDLIADYFQRPQVNQIMVEKAKVVMESGSIKTVFIMNTKWFLKWCSPVFVALYMIVAAEEVINGTLPLGNFLATVSVIKSISSDCLEGYGDYRKVTSTYKALVRVTNYLNFATDLPDQKKVESVRRIATKEKREELMKSQRPPGIPASDLLPIKLSECAYNNHVGEAVLQNVNISVPQGKAVMVVGHHMAGKSSLMRLLANREQPSEGTVFVPTHLRILHVNQNPILMNFSPYKNLVFGVSNPKDINPKRIAKLLDCLDLKRVLELVSDDLSKVLLGEPLPEEPFDPDMGWQKRLTQSEIVRMHLARALIMNPEVIVCHRPLSMFTAATSKTVFDVLLTHVRERGLCLPESGRPFRRPRTMFWTSVEDQREIGTDEVVWCMKRCGSESHPCYVTDVTAEYQSRSAANKQVQMQHQQMQPQVHGSMQPGQMPQPGQMMQGQMQQPGQMPPGQPEPTSARDYRAMPKDVKGPPPGPTEQQQVDAIQAQGNADSTCMDRRRRLCWY